MENFASDFEQHIPSFFKNSCPGTSAEGVTEEDCFSKNSPGSLTRPSRHSLSENQVVVGGITCCVPGCFSNSLRNPELSLYVIPNGKSKEKQELRKRWLHMISRQNFDNPGPGHRVCSLHFIGGRKTYMNNVPTIVPKSKGRKEQMPRPTCKARNRPSILQKTMAQGEILNSSMPTTSPVQNQELEQAEEANVAGNEDPGVGTERVLRERIAQLELEVKRLKEANEELSQQKSPTDGDIKGSNFSVNAFKSNPKLFRYYTGLPDYETFRIILESFGPAVDNLVYIGSNTSASKITSADYVKKAQKGTYLQNRNFFLFLFD